MSKAACFPPIVSSAPQALILGSMPGVKSLQEQQYYAHPQNSFWKILGALFDMPVATYPQRVALIKKNRLALWDVLSSCERPGSLDSKIDPATVEVNDFDSFLKEYEQITRVFFNGATAEKEFTRRVLPRLPKPVAARLTLKRLPSTSPAHAGVKVERKIKEWSAILAVLLLFFPMNAHAEAKKNDCWSRSQTHVQAVDCEVRQAKKIKAELDELVVKMERNAEKLEADMKAAGSSQYEGLSRLIQDSQEEFEAYEKAQCKFETSIFGAGTAAADAEPLCEAELMKQRIKRLKSF